MSKILYDLKIATEESGRDGQRMVVVTATVRRYDLDPATKMAKPIPEPATRVDRAISYQALAACRRPADVREAERNAAVDEAMRVAVRRGPYVALAEPGWWRSKQELKTSFPVEEKAEIDRLRGKYPDLEAGQLRTLAAGLRHVRRRGAVGPASTGPGTWCRTCGWHDSMDDSGVCRRCGNVEELSSILAASARTECTCAKCGTMAHPIKEGDGGYCIVCVETLRENAKKRDGEHCQAQARAQCQHEVCPECGGTGEVQLFTSTRPCSKCGGK